MPVLFKPELDYYLSTKGMRIKSCVEWMTGKEPGFDTWGVCFVARVNIMYNLSFSVRKTTESRKTILML